MRAAVTPHPRGALPPAQAPRRLRPRGGAHRRPGHPRARHARARRVDRRGPARRAARRQRHRQVGTCDPDGVLGMAACQAGCGCRYTTAAALRDAELAEAERRRAHAHIRAWSPAPGLDPVPSSSATHLAPPRARRSAPCRSSPGDLRSGRRWALSPPRPVGRRLRRPPPRRRGRRPPYPGSTEEERMSSCGWVLRCSWDNGFVRITSEPQGAPIRCYQRATPTG